MNNFLNLSVAQLKRAVAIKEEIESLLAELASILGTTPAPAPVAAAAPAAATDGAPAPARKKKRKLSPEGRAKIVAAAKARWAKKRKGAK